MSSMKKTNKQKTNFKTNTVLLCTGSIQYSEKGLRNLSAVPAKTLKMLTQGFLTWVL